MSFLGIDTSNYTTSVAVFDEKNATVVHKKQILPISDGALGLRQSDAVFNHIKNFPKLISDLFYENNFNNIKAVGVSSKPRNIEGSYMPCFLSGVMAATSAASVLGCNLYEFSHQEGHIAAALYSTNNLHLINEQFIAFHISGGTTECLLVSPDDDKIFDIKLLAKTLDLNAGQVVDRIGVSLGLKFPCGMELDKLSQQSQKTYNIKPSIKGADCCLSGIENKCANMLKNGENPADIANYCIEYIKQTLDKMTETVISQHKGLPIIFAGGVMSNSKIKKYMQDKYNAFFATPEFSSDNAAGIAILTSIKAGEIIAWTKYYFSITTKPIYKI